MAQRTLCAVFVVACGDGAVLLESGKEVFDQVVRLAQVEVIAARVLAQADQWNHHCLAGELQRLDYQACALRALSAMTMAAAGVPLSNTSPPSRSWDCPGVK